MRRLFQALFLTAAVFSAGAQTARPPQNETLQAETAADGVKAEKTAAAAEEAAENGADTAAAGGTNGADTAAAGGTAADSQKTAADLTENVSAEQLLPLLGCDPRTAFEAFGAPVSLNVLRGGDPSLDDVVSVHESGIYLFWFRDRVWQIGFGSYFGGTFEGVTIGTAEEEVSEKLGKPQLREDSMAVYEIFYREFPVSMRFVFRDAKVAEMYLYRSDL